MVPLSLLVFRQLMLILCNTQHYGQLIEEEFNLVTDPNRCVNRFRFDLIINSMSKFFSYIGESTLHGPHLIGAIIQECFEKVNSNNHTLLSLNGGVFTNTCSKTVYSPY